MTKEGYTAVTIRKEVYELLKALKEKDVVDSCQTCGTPLENRNSAGGFCPKCDKWQILSMSAIISHVTKEYMKKLKGGEETG